MREGSGENEDGLDELGKFVLLLERLRTACGRPSLRQLSRVSRRVREIYGRHYPQLPPELSLTALSDVLGRRRKKPPPWNWVALYVLSCQRFAAESGLRPDPRDATLPTWNLRLQAVYHPGTTPPADEEIIPADGPDPERMERSPAGPGAPRPRDRREPLSAPVGQDDDRRAPDGPADDDGAGAPGGRTARDGRDGHDVRDIRDVRGHDRPADPVDPADPAATTISRTVAELEDYAGGDRPSLSEQRFFALYGQHGVRLLRSAESGDDHDAEYRLGVLLCIDRRPRESLAWLMRAEAGGHVRARTLIESPAQRHAALSHAWEIGARDARDAPYDHESARVYLERAARNGHAGAAFDLGTWHMEREDPERAAAWFAKAAENGHPIARWWWNGAGPARTADRRPSSPPTVLELMTRLYGEPPAGAVP